MVAPAITRNPVELRGCCWLAALLSVVSGALRQLERGDYRGMLLQTTMMSVILMPSVALRPDVFSYTNYSGITGSKRQAVVVVLRT